MNRSNREKIMDHLDSHDYIHLATVSPEGKPLSHTVRYVAEGDVVYFLAGCCSNLFQDIIRNRKVSFTIDEYHSDSRSMRGVLMEGSARLATGREEISRVVERFIEKFPRLRENPPGCEDLLLKIIPTAEYFIDETETAGYREKVRAC